MSRRPPKSEELAAVPRAIWTRVYFDLDTDLSDKLNDLAYQMRIPKKILIHNIIKEYLSAKGKK